MATLERYPSIPFPLRIRSIDAAPIETCRARLETGQQVRSTSLKAIWLPTLTNHSPQAKRVLHLCAYVGSFLAVLVISIRIGVDANWDLRNYHLYNGRALINAGFRRDVATAGIQSFLNPLGDAPYGVLTRLLGPHAGIMLAAGLIQWLCYVSIWRLTGEFVALTELKLGRIVAFVAVIFGSGALSFAFTSFGDWAIAALLAEALTRVLRAQTAEAHLQPRLWNQAGLFLGVATALKLTAVPFVAAFIVVSFMVGGATRMLRMTTASSIGFIVTGGPWMAYLWIKYGNPVFPLYNGIFTSTSAPASNFDDNRYGATSLQSVFEFPVRLFTGTTKYSEILLRDWRFVALFVLAFASLLVSPERQPKTPRSTTEVLAPILIISYLIWIVQFGIYRYFLFGELLTSLLLVLLAIQIWPHKRPVRIVALVIPLILGSAYQIAPNWGRDEQLWNQQLHDFAASTSADHISVIFSGPPPLSYLTASISGSSRFAALTAFENGDLLPAGELGNQLTDLVSDGLAANDLFMISDVGASNPTFPLDDLNAVDCQPFESIGRDLQFCRLERP